jgi:hypothetical protein
MTCIMILFRGSRICLMIDTIVGNLEIQFSLKVKRENTKSYGAPTRTYIK